MKLTNLKSQHKDIAVTLLNHMWRLISGPISMLLIPVCLTKDQQGYWYLFAGLSALSVFADLGFTNILLQFSAHEFAFLRFGPDGLPEGDEYHLKKLGSFLRFSLKWVTTICVVVFPVIFAVGLFFLHRDGVVATYIVPWTVFALGTMISFFGGAILSFIEGLDRIASVQRVRIRFSVLNTVIVVVVLLSGGSLYAIALGMFFGASSIFLSVFGKYRKLLSHLLLESKDFCFSWGKDVLPLFTRYAVTFSSGYFIFQIYTPLMHAFHGPSLSGEVGISLSLASAIFGMAGVWIYTITPKVNMLVANSRWDELDGLFRKRLLLSVLTYALVVGGLVLFILYLGNFWLVPRIISRFLPFAPFAMLVLCYFLQVPINAWSLYLRGHKKEPYVVPSIVSAVWIVAGTYLAGRFLPPEWFFVGFLSCYVWLLPVDYAIYRRCRKNWHVAEAQ